MDVPDILRVGVFTGFEFQKIHHQELARPSAKSLLQPFGSAQRDFYLRFNKAKAAVSKPEKIDEVRSAGRARSAGRP